MVKVEWEGDGFIGLNAKTYYCFNSDDTKDKYSAKGISKALKLQKDEFLAVLQSKAIPAQTNKGFIFKDNSVFTYEMRKDGLKHFYCKRKVLSDGISTTYLNI